MYNKEEYINKQDNYYAHQREEMLKYIPIDAKNILEIGCGNGSFGNLVKKNLDCTYWGIEPDSRFVEVASRNLDVFKNALFDVEIDLPKKLFDCIVLNDVLEHMLYPEDTLKLCSSFLNNRGVIVSSIPNIRFAPYLYRLFYLGEFEYADAGIMDKTHLRFFTKSSIQNLYTRCGYELQKHVGINAALPKKFRVPFFLLNLISKGRFEDTKYQQFATVALLK